MGALGTEERDLEGVSERTDGPSPPRRRVAGFGAGFGAGRRAAEMGGEGEEAWGEEGCCKRFDELMMSEVEVCSALLEVRCAALRG